MNPSAQSLPLNVVFCTVYSISQLQLTVLFKDRYANAESSSGFIPILSLCWKSKSIISEYTVSNSSVCARVDMENRRREEFGVAVAHFFFPFSSVFPLSLRCCQSPWGRISAAAIGRPRLSKYTFNFLRLCRLALFSFSLCCAGSPGPWVGESLWVLASGSGLLKKMQVIYWEKWRSLSN